MGFNKLSKGLIRAAALVLLAATISGTSVFADAVTDRGAIPAVIEKTTSSVVAIIGKPSDSKNSKDLNRYDLAHGTGVIVKSDGYILTNAHVVKNMRNINVVTSDGRSFPGKTTHFDEESDLALVKIEAAGLTPATFAAQTDIKVGEPVIAIGTPLSFALRNSVTYGIVSGMDRSVQSKYQLIQTDAAINPGNSGGALVNMKGQVIGINTLKYVRYGVDGLGFAIPVDTVQHVLNHFFKYGKVKRASLGLELAESWEAVVGLPSGKALEVSYVEPESPAAKAGIKQGDLLLSIDSKKTRNQVEYNELLKNFLPGDKVRLTLQTGGQPKETDLVLGEDRFNEANLVQDSDGSYIDADQGKTQIGDSHYGWSMKYPAGLVKVNQSPNADNILFADAKGEYAINIVIQEKQSEDLSPLGLLKKLSAKASDTILEKRYVEHPPQPYAKLVGKRESGGVYQFRAFLKEDKIFYVMLIVEKEENYNNDSKRNSYYDLLDTFKLSFDANNTALKDVSAYQSGKTVTTDYGLSFDVPLEWSKKETGGGLVLANKDGEQSLTVRVSSAASGDTLKDWAGRQERKFTDGYIAAYREVAGQKEITIGGAAAIENGYASTMGDKWRQSHVVYILKDKYKYELKFSYPRTADSKEIEELISTFENSVKFTKDALNRSLGFIQDEDDLTDKNKLATYTNKKYRYSLHVPESWLTGYQSDQDSAYKQFSFDGGSLQVSADDRSSKEETVNKLEQEHKKSIEADASYKHSASDEMMFDLEVRKFSTVYKSKNVPYTLNEFVFEKNGITYTIRLRINDAVKTDEQWQRLENAILSLQILSK